MASVSLQIQVFVVIIKQCLYRVMQGYTVQYASLLFFSVLLSVSEESCFSLLNVSARSKPLLGDVVR